MMMNG
jgi:hypothetical protein